MALVACNQSREATRGIRQVISNLLLRLRRTDCEQPVLPETDCKQENPSVDQSATAG